MFFVVVLALFKKENASMRAHVSRLGLSQKQGDWLRMRGVAKRWL
jgi:hypothetical protein